MPRPATLQSNTATRTIEWISCGRWRPTWFARKVAVIAAVAGKRPYAKTLTSTIPILFTSGVDPVKAGLVASLNRPEANVTGVSWFSAELGQKHIELLHELAPKLN